MKVHCRFRNEEFAVQLIEDPKTCLLDVLEQIGKMRGLKLNPKQFFFCHSSKSTVMCVRVVGDRPFEIHEHEQLIGVRSDDQNFSPAHKRALSTLPITPANRKRLWRRLLAPEESKLHAIQ